jgi:hypothetical protein
LRYASRVGDLLEEIALFCAKFYIFCFKFYGGEDSDFFSHHVGRYFNTRPADEV